QVVVGGSRREQRRSELSRVVAGEGAVGGAHRGQRVGTGGADRGVADVGGEVVGGGDGDEVLQTLEPVDVGVERRGPDVEGVGDGRQAQRLEPVTIHEVDRLLRDGRAREALACHGPNATPTTNPVQLY